MAKLTKTDEFLERLGIEMDHIKAGLIELKARGRKLGLEARLDFEKGLESIEKTEKDLKVRMEEWAKAGGEGRGGHEDGAGARRQGAQEGRQRRRFPPQVTA